ncbi:MAG: cytochrome c [bacterium]
MTATSQLVLPLLILGSSLLAGCGLDFGAGPRDYALGEASREALQGDSAALAALLAELEGLYGSSTAPKLKTPFAQAGSPPGELSAKLYRRECLHCHGNEGGGDGHTGFSLKPVPRDFRLGYFKYTPLAHGARPEQEDLERTISQGIAGTAMPSFGVRLTKSQIAGLADFVRLLAMRGEAESYLVAEYEDTGEVTGELAAQAAEWVRENWLDPDRERIGFAGPIPPATAASLVRGRQLYLAEEGANCAICHGAEGLGDGPAALRPASHGSTKLVPAFEDVWGHQVEARNLKSGPFFHGEAPIDIYRRILVGINGTPMPGLAGAFKASGEALLLDEDLWALAHFVHSLAHPEAYETLPDLATGGH